MSVVDDDIDDYVDGDADAQSDRLTPKTKDSRNNDWHSEILT